MRLLLSAAAAAVCVFFAGGVSGQAPLNVGFLWHMHQPIYTPGQTIQQTDASGRYSFSVTDVHNQRFGPYTSWPKDAVQSGQSLPHLGAQVSFSGSLIENLSNLEAAGTNGGMWNNWEQSYRQAALLDTSLGNPRLDLIGFGYHHPLGPLLDERDLRMQIKLHKLAVEQTFGPGVPYSKGFFPAETAFSERMIPALAAEGIEWTIFDSIHLERAIENYPHTDASNLYAPNRADQVNPAIPASEWVQLNNLWAPSKVAAPMAYRPHLAQYIDPATGQATQITAVPAARYEGNEDGRGGFGALQYESVMEQYRQFNTDPNHPMMVLLHHDGDNYGGGSEGYYHGNFQNMVDWAQANPNYDVTTVQDYLDRYPVAPGDVVHIESGSWAGADNGDPEFKKWLGDPNSTTGWSPDRNSWAVLTAAKNFVYTANDLELGVGAFPNVANVKAGVGSASDRGWHYLLQAQASDHWYWDGTESWDSNVTLGSNLAIDQVLAVVNGAASETTAPTVFLPQRESYNPGGQEYGRPQPSDFEVWTYAYDVSGLSNVQLKYRVDVDGVNPIASTQNETYAGGAEVGDWLTLDMTSSDITPPVGILAPRARALRYGAMVEGVTDSLLDYYVEAVDSLGNVQRTDIQHVWVGGGTIAPNSDRVVLTPDPAVAGQTATFAYDPAGGVLSDAAQVFAHVGFNNWSTIVSPDAEMTWDAEAGLWSLDVTIPTSATQLDLVFNNGAGVWDNNGGGDWHFSISGGVDPVGFVMDGVLDAGAKVAASDDGRTLWFAFEGGQLYLATNDAGEGGDVFIYLADQPGEMRAANWAKVGQVADWDAYIADENNNDYEAWFDAQGATQVATGPNGGVLEAVIDLASEFSSLPDELYVAVAQFATGDGGALQWVLGELTADGSIQANEYVRLAYAAGLPGDFNGDGQVDAADYTVWRDTAGSTSQFAADANGDGKIDASDYAIWVANYGRSTSATTAVPEPSSIATVFAAIGLMAVCPCGLKTSRR